MVGIEAGANVVMPNLFPVKVRDKYVLYNGKVCTGDEAAACSKKAKEPLKRMLAL